jgi:hypothetical protein
MLHTHENVVRNAWHYGRCVAENIGTAGVYIGCPANEEPVDGTTRCQCRPGFYNSNYGLVRCPGQGAVSVFQQRGLECQSCGGCLDCTVKDGRHAALVRPGFALGPAAAVSYQGVDSGAPHVDKFLHSCSRCEGEDSTVPWIQCRTGHDPSSPLYHGVRYLYYYMFR